MTMPTRSAVTVTLVPAGVRTMSRPPKPAFLVFFIRNSLTKRRSTFRFTMRRMLFSLLIIFTSELVVLHVVGIWRLKEDLEVHLVVVLGRGSTTRTGHEATLDGPAVGGDVGDDLSSASMSSCWCRALSIALLST
ncbi:MAG: hypothetical protein CM15mP79_1870 [Methanobacteriota archaeon]|nr:MAG: hypothetical protein CM15mP79_1870 [Euryarchaeota archaeon]